MSTGIDTRNPPPGMFTQPVMVLIAGKPAWPAGAIFLRKFTFRGGKEIVFELQEEIIWKMMTSLAECQLADG